MCEDADDADADADDCVEDAVLTLSLALSCSAEEELLPDVAEESENLRASARTSSLWAPPYDGSDANAAAARQSTRSPSIRLFFFGQATGASARVQAA